MRITRRWVWLIVAIGFVGLGVAVMTRGVGFTARASPSSFEEAVMRGARHWATPSAMRDRRNPVEPSSDVMQEAMAHWADHCALCHDNDGSGRTATGKGLYPPVPDMRAGRTQDLTDGELFYVIERGIPFTGMPAWGNGTPESEQQSWALVRFIRHLSRLTDEEIHRMEKLNPKSAEQIEQERRMNEFLKGRSGK